MPDLTPLDDRALIRPDKPETTTGGGLTIVSHTDKDNTRGEVIAIGGTVNEDGHADQHIAVGQRVMFSKYAGVKVDHENGDGEPEELLILKRADILALERA